MNDYNIHMQSMLLKCKFDFATNSRAVNKNPKTGGSDVTVCLQKLREIVALIYENDVISVGL